MPSITHSHARSTTLGRAATSSTRAPISRRLADERAIWGLSVRATGALLVAPLILLVAGIALLVFWPDAYWPVSAEDSLIEWLQVAALGVAGIGFLLLARRYWTMDRRWMAAVAGVAGIGMFFVLGEEISWGQRIFGIATPAWLEAENIQGETNLHNLAVAEVFVRGGYVGVAAYAAIVPLLVLLSGRSVGVDRLWIPPVALLTFFLPLVAYWLIRIPLVPVESQARYSEFVELNLYAGLALVAWLNLRRVAARTVEPAPASPSRPSRSSVGAT
jgi:hypothetical protein